MGNVFVCSDWHFMHDRQFIWSARGFNNVHEMNEAIIKRHNAVVKPDDDVYVLGDLALGGSEQEILESAQRLIEQINGRIHIILGNHDSPKRIEMYKKCINVVEVTYATMLKYRGYHFFLTYYPCMTANLEKETLKQCIISISGHTHSTNPFYNDIPFMYNCAMDAHNCTPVLLDDAIEEMKAKVKECKEEL